MKSCVETNCRYFSPGQFLSTWLCGLSLAICLSGSALLLNTWTMPQVAAQELDAESERETRMKYAIAIHGGAGSSPDLFSDEANAARTASMRQALQIGTDILKDGGTALDAVEKVVNFLENDPQFNAGKGAVFNAEGKHELDASIMDGSDLSCGAVAGVRTVKNPISLARLVMTETRHVLLASAGAEQFAAGFEDQLEFVENTYFDTPGTLRAWERTKRRRENQVSSSGQQLQIEIEDTGVGQPDGIEDGDTGSYMGTVGCVALDSDGNLAAATSTGGMTNKKFGRVGDSPIVGAGTYADNKTCAVSCTGHGEQFIRHAVAYNVSARMRFLGQDLAESVHAVLTEDLAKGDGGLIAVDRFGNISMETTTAGMARAAADSSGRFEVIWAEDRTSQK